MKIKDMKKAVELFIKEWDLGEKECGASRRLCAWIYLMELLEESEQFVYYRENGKMLGFAGYENYNSRKHFLRKRLFGYIKKRLYKSKQIKDIDALRKYEDSYWYVPKNLENYFDGQVSILILDEEYRGRGIGRKLLLEVFELAKKDNIKNLQILNDESCNCNIYEKVGCNKIYETIVENQVYGEIGSVLKEKAYIYEKIL